MIAIVEIVIWIIIGGVYWTNVTADFFKKNDPFPKILNILW